MRKPVRDLAQAQLAADVLDTPLALTQAGVELLLRGVSTEAPLRRRDLAAAGFLDDGDDDQAALAVTSDGIAVIPIHGALRKHARWYDRYAGLTSYQGLLAQIAEAADSGRVRGVLLDVNSPGGLVQGMFEVADALAALGKIKPLHAVADENAASAAYLLTSQAARITAPTTGILGSVGVLSVRLDASGAHEAEGLRFTFVTSGQRKGDGDPAKPAAHAELASMQRKVDTVATAMVARVAAGRGTTPAAIAALEADTFMGADAVEHGLADALGTTDDAMAGLLAVVTRRAAPDFRATTTETSQAGEADAMSDETTQAAGAAAETSAAGAPETPADPSAAAPTTPTAEVIDFATDPRVTKIRDEAAAAARQEEQARATAILDACDLVSRADLVGALQRDVEVTAANVRDKLQAMRAAEGDRTALRTGVGPGAEAPSSQLMSTTEALSRWRNGNTPQPAA